MTGGLERARRGCGLPTEEVDMEDRERGQRESDAESESERSRSKKAYSAPELIEWGTILELTHGTKSSFQDFPKAGGSKGV